ncbi:hypothetical protein CEXT_780181 [Caerostris extrusa]|uniref:Uncharacterized protein n=1 Tax=Caerostris extrusa TaxID=172846 RepID=A0AAV4SAW1_CAEEX|nr:hypothetical protein CEXT_780181 [Caerostris extrusa]
MFMLLVFSCLVVAQAQLYDNVHSHHAPSYQIRHGSVRGYGFSNYRGIGHVNHNGGHSGFRAMLGQMKWPSHPTMVQITSLFTRLLAMTDFHIQNMDLDTAMD